MAHHIRGLVGAPALLTQIAEAEGLLAPLSLTPTLSILPLGYFHLDALGAAVVSPVHAGFTYLDDALAARFAAFSSAGPLVYLETDYFGGLGQQAAALFEAGVLTFAAHEETFTDSPPAGPVSPISQALGRLGVVVAPGVSDAFAAVGLGRFRDMEDLGVREDEGEDWDGED